MDESGKPNKVAGCRVSAGNVKASCCSPQPPPLSSVKLTRPDGRMSRAGRAAGVTKMKTQKDTVAAIKGKALAHELYQYHNAGGHTRAELAKANLIQAGFTFKDEGNERAIYWPDGVRLEYDKSGGIVYRSWSEQKKIDVTPTWAAMLPVLLMILKDATEEGNAEARIEMGRMAQIADVWNKHAQALIDTGKKSQLHDAALNESGRANKAAFYKAVRAAEADAAKVGR